MPNSDPATATSGAPSREEQERQAARRRGQEVRDTPGSVASRDPYLGRAQPDLAFRAFATLAESVRDIALFLMDAEGVITFWGEGARLIKGWEREEAEGSHLRFLYPDGGSEDGTAEAHLVAAAETGEYTGEGYRLRKDGTLFWGRISITALRDLDGVLMGFAKLTRDLTDQRKAEEARAAAREAELQAQLAKQAFVTRMAGAEEEVEERVAVRTQALTSTHEEMAGEMAWRTRLEGTRNALLRQLAATEEQERLRLSRELHDQMGQLVTALLLGLKALGRRPGGSPEGLADLETLAEQIAGEVHTIAAALRPPALDRLGLRRALQAHLEEWAERYGIAADFQAIGIEEERFAPEVETALFRAAQEALTNVAKHAEAQRVSLVLERLRGNLGVIVEDDGCGFDVDAEATRAAELKRIGLLGVGERIELLGGALEIESEPGVGTTVYARLPHDAIGASSEGAGA